MLLFCGGSSRDRDLRWSEALILDMEAISLSASMCVIVFTSVLCCYRLKSSLKASKMRKTLAKLESQEKRGE